MSGNFEGWVVFYGKDQLLMNRFISKIRDRYCLNDALIGKMLSIYNSIGMRNLDLAKSYQKHSTNNDVCSDIFVFSCICEILNSCKSKISYHYIPILTGDEFTSPDLKEFGGDLGEWDHGDDYIYTPFNLLKDDKAFFVWRLKDDAGIGVGELMEFLGVNGNSFDVNSICHKKVIEYIDFEKSKVLLKSIFV